MTQMTVDHWTAATEMPDAPDWLQQVRRDAWERFQQTGWPSRKDDRYKFSDLKHLEAGLEPAVPGTVRMEDIQPFLTGDEAALLVFVDGRYDAGLSHPGELDGLVTGPMQVGLAYPQTRHHFEQMAKSDDPMELLHCATWQDGAFVLAEKPVDGPVHVMMVNTGAGGMRNLHHAFVADDGADVTVLESHIHLDDDDGTTLSFAMLASGGHLRHVKVQKEDRRARHVGSQRTAVLRDGHAQSVLVDIGGARSRQGTTADLLGENSEVDLQGVFFGQREQRKDVWTRVDHHLPHGRSNELFKGIMDDASRGAFTGLIVVHSGASKTHSEQENRNLLLSADAHIDATPQLIINNDDVSCSHGSTIGQLDTDQLFFLRSRGIGLDQARMVLTRAFASEVIESVREASIRKLLAKYLHVWFIKHQEHL